MRETAIDGWAPHSSASVVSSAAPVGVQSSRSIGPPELGTPRRSSTTAGGGTGRRPCSVSTVPPPTDTRETTTVAGARWTKPAQTPTTSAIASRAPTSWKCTSSGDIPCTRPSASASRAKTSWARERTSSCSRASLSSRSTSRQVRRTAVSATSTWQRVAAKPPRRTPSALSLTSPGATFSTASASSPMGTPALTSAPSSMSPLAPEEASIQTVGRDLLSHGRLPGRCGRPGRRRRPRRSRCRC